MLPKSVLVIDDDREICLSLGALLSSWGIKVTIAEDGIGALHKLQKQPVELLLIDYRLPGGNGVDLYQRLQSNTNFIRLPVIFMSGFPQSEIDPNCGLMNRVGFLSKPIDPKQLREAIEALFPDNPPQAA